MLCARCTQSMGSQNNFRGYLHDESSRAKKFPSWQAARRWSRDEGRWTLPASVWCYEAKCSSFARRASALPVGLSLDVRRGSAWRRRAGPASACSHSCAPCAARRRAPGTGRRGAAARRAQGPPARAQPHAACGPASRQDQQTGPVTGSAVSSERAGRGDSSCLASTTVLCHPASTQRRSTSGRRSTRQSLPSPRANARVWTDSTPRFLARKVSRAESLTLHNLAHSCPDYHHERPFAAAQQPARDAGAPGEGSHRLLPPPPSLLHGLPLRNEQRRPRGLGRRETEGTGTPSPGSSAL